MNKLLDVWSPNSGWLEEIGFTDVDCAWKWREMALLVATRPGLVLCPWFMGDAYGSDLTYVHDTGHGDLARAAAQTVMEDRFVAAVASGGRVVDLGCGSGVFARALLDAGSERARRAQACRRR